MKKKQSQELPLKECISYIPKSHTWVLRNIETVILVRDLEHRKILRVSLQYSRKTIRIETDRIYSENFILHPSHVDY